MINDADDELSEACKDLFNEIIKCLHIQEIVDELQKLFNNIKNKLR